MKKDRNSRKDLLDLYLYMDVSESIKYDEEISEKVKEKYNKIKDKYDKIYGDRVFPPYEWNEYYGLFKAKNGRIAIDPKRFEKKIGLSNKQLLLMNKRNTTYFHPNKKEYIDYDVNVLVDEINQIKDDFKKTYKPIIDKSINDIKEMKTLYAGDYDKLMMGISGVGAANAWANYMNAKNEYELQLKKKELFNSLYAQFLHSMTSRIEAATIQVYIRHNPKMKDFNRNYIYDNININGKSPRELPSFKYHDKLYSIWNFSKHNNLRTYETLKDRYPEVLVETEYIPGDLAIKYLKLDEKLIIELLDGTKKFFIEWCEISVNEKYDEAKWNYDYWFIEQVSNTIEGIVNPLGLTIFDEMD